MILDYSLEKCRRGVEIADNEPAAVEVDYERGPFGRRSGGTIPAEFDGGVVAGLEVEFGFGDGWVNGRTGGECG